MEVVPHFGAPTTKKFGKFPANMEYHHCIKNMALPQNLWVEQGKKI